MLVALAGVESLVEQPVVVEAEAVVDFRYSDN